MNHDIETRIPRYQEVIDDLMEQIKAGDFSFEEPLCTEAKLMDKFGISRITVRRALDELESKGLIYRKRGIGCFVNREAYKNLMNDRQSQPARVTQSKEQNRLFAFIFPFDLSRTGLNDAFSAANEYLIERGCYAALYITKEDIETRGRTVLTKLMSMNVSGVAYYPKTGDCHIDFLNKLIFQRKSVVVLDVESHCPYISSVSCDNLNGSLMLMEHLTKLGHKKIAYISGVSPQARSSVGDRFAGYLLGHERAGLPVHPEFITTDLADQTLNIQQSTLALRNLMGRYVADGVTAVIAENDSLAYHIALCCRNMGLRIPEQMSICGFDNSEWAHALERAEDALTITTIEQDQAAAGREAARILLENVDKPIHFATSLVLPVKLVIGNSTAAPLDGGTRA